MLKERKVYVASMAAVCLIIVSSAWADDLIPPPWRGSERTTYQHWTFDDNDNPAEPEIVDNAWGTPQAEIQLESWSEGWYEISLGRHGVWGDVQSITIDIGNWPDPLDHKDVWVQVTYYKSPSNEPVVSIQPAQYLGGETRQLEAYGPGCWWLQQSMWRIEPNPDHELIRITTGPSGMTIDQIVIDTICIPEPTTISLFALLAFGLMVRRNH